MIKQETNDIIPVALKHTTTSIIECAIRNELICRNSRSPFFSSYSTTCRNTFSIRMYAYRYGFTNFSRDKDAWGASLLQSFDQHTMPCVVVGFLDVLVVHQEHIRHGGAGFVLAEFE